MTAVALPRLAAADTMDPALERLVAGINKGTGLAPCQARSPSGGVVYNPASGFNRCLPDNVAFADLVAQYGYALAPTAMHSARTTGYGGFELAIEGDYTTIDSSADYWKRGTQGPLDPTTKKFSIDNPNPPGILQDYSIKIRKGFPFGLEITGNVGYVAQTNLVFGGADVRMSLFEGFRTGIPAIFPEVAVGGSVRTATGTSEMQLTVAGFDAEISKPIPLGGTVVITPYAGYQWIRIFGDSGLIDFTPNTDAVNFCGYAGNNTPATPDKSKAGADGQPTCRGGNSADFNNVGVFNAVRLTRHRIMVGGQIRFQMVKIGLHADIEPISPEDANKGVMVTDNNQRNPDGSAKQVQAFSKTPFEPAVSNQLTLAFDIGAEF
ncbi:MAG TPA: hypothetical protein VHB21_25360 [Minicystis sp.]|nr:hypothetical protein [Minicystis sp.]